MLKRELENHYIKKKSIKYNVLFLTLSLHTLFHLRVNSQYKTPSLITFWLVTVSLMLCGYSCRDRATEPTTDSIQLTAEDVLTTEVWLKLSLPADITPRTVTLKRSLFLQVASRYFHQCEENATHPVEVTRLDLKSRFNFRRLFLL